MIWAINQPINHTKLLSLQPSLQHYLPPSVSLSLLFVVFLMVQIGIKIMFLKLVRQEESEWFLEKSHTGCTNGKKVCLLPVWKVFIQLIFSLQGESKIGMHFSGKLLKPECPVNPSSSSRLTASLSLSWESWEYRNPGEKAVT